jgi:hypothetical protein
MMMRRMMMVVMKMLLMLLMLMHMIQFHQRGQRINPQTLRFHIKVREETHQTLIATHRGAGAGTVGQCRGT